MSLLTFFISATPGSETPGHVHTCALDLRVLSEYEQNLEFYCSFHDGHTTYSEMYENVSLGFDTFFTCL